MKVRLETSSGNIDLQLDAERAPETVSNFVEYVNAGFYDGTVFHRVIPGFMVQGGGFEPGMNQKQCRAPIQNEADNGASNNKGSIAMARTSDPHSATAQFFINCSDNDFLNFRGKNPNEWGYCVFGEVADGIAVVESIEAVATTNRAGHQDVPAEDVLIERARVLEE